LSAAFEFLGMKFHPEQHLRFDQIRVRSLDKMPEFMPGAALNAKFDVLYVGIEHQRHIVYKKVPPIEFYFWLAPQGTPYSSLNLPPIVRPHDAGAPCVMKFFSPDLSDREMDEFSGKADMSGHLRALVERPPDIYAKTYRFDDSLRLHTDPERL
jgi:hypothetical protein